MKKFVRIVAVFGLAGAGALLAPTQAADVSWCATDTGEDLGQPDPCG